MSDLDTFKAQLDIVSIAAACTEVERGKILCPEHDDSNPSCQLYPLTNSYFCWTCKASGDVLKLVMLLRNLSLPEAIDWISETTGVDRPPRDPGAEAQSISLKALQAHLSEALEALPADTPLPGDLTLERAKALGLGYAHDLAGVIESSPRHLLSPDEVRDWEGGWSLELYGRGGGLLGFGAFLPVAPIEEEPEPEFVGEPVDDEERDEAPSDDESLFDQEADDRADASFNGASDGLQPQTPPSPVSASNLSLPSAALGRWVKAAGLRSPSFVGLPAAHKIITKRKAVAISPDLAAFIEMSAAGFPGLIAPAGAIDAGTAAAIASLGSQVIVVVSPAYRHSSAFFSDLWALASTGVRVELVPRSPDGQLGGRLSLFEYLAIAATQAHDSGHAERIRPLLDEYLRALPSRSTREIYTAELHSRSLR
jgi:hypothetical protein